MGGEGVPSKRRKGGIVLEGPVGGEKKKLVRKGKIPANIRDFSGNPSSKREKGLLPGQKPKGINWG